LELPDAALVRVKVRQVNRVLTLRFLHDVVDELTETGVFVTTGYSYFCPVVDALGSERRFE
jgi:hypothetical protein